MNKNIIDFIKDKSLLRLKMGVLSIGLIVNEETFTEVL